MVLLSADICHNSEWEKTQIADKMGQCIKKYSLISYICCNGKDSCVSMSMTLLNQSDSAMIIHNQILTVMQHSWNLYDLFLEMPYREGLTLILKTCPSFSLPHLILNKIKALSYSCFLLSLNCVIFYLTILLYLSPN